VYTPLLPGAASGTVEDRSIIEPIRNPLSKKSFAFYEAYATNVDPRSRLVQCKVPKEILGEQEDEVFQVRYGAPPNPPPTLQTCVTMYCSLPSIFLSMHPFPAVNRTDFCVVAVGSVPNTFGVPGVNENAVFFKEIEDAARLRREVNERLERASLPGTADPRKDELLNFVFVGAGPTGIELAAELYDTFTEGTALHC